MNRTGRRALTTIQMTGGSTSDVENEMVGHKKNGGQEGAAPSKLTPSKNALTRVMSAGGGKGVVKKKVATTKVFTSSTKETQTENADIALVTGDTEPMEYWKELAETRRIALEETLEENEQLHARVEELEKEKVLLEGMVEQAKALASMIEDLEDDPDESGIGFQTGSGADDSVLEKDTA